MRMRVHGPPMQSESVLQLNLVEAAGVEPDAARTGVWFTDFKGNENR